MKVADIKFYCDICEDHRPVEIEPLTNDDLNDANWGDIVCTKCHLVIATITADKPGIYRFVKVSELLQLQRPKHRFETLVEKVGFLFVAVSLIITVGTRLHHLVVNPKLTEAQALTFYCPMWLAAIGMAVIGIIILKVRSDHI